MFRAVNIKDITMRKREDLRTMFEKKGCKIKKHLLKRPTTGFTIATASMYNLDHLKLVYNTQATPEILYTLIKSFSIH